MKRVLKLLPLALLLAALLAFGTACGSDDAEGIRIALVAHSPTSMLDDGSFNAGANDGIQRFAEEHGIPAANIRFFQAQEETDDARVDTIAGAINDFGADIVVMPGFNFIASSATVQDMFPDTNFILLDASPAGGAADNLVAIHYAEEQSGFLAGYAAVREGFRSLGFMGGRDVPAVIRFGHGFIQGAEHAASVLGLGEGEITIAFTYLGDFAPSPAFVTQAEAWYAEGIEVIFAAAGGAGGSVMAAAERAGTWVIGVDVDQEAASETVISSAMKSLAESVYAMLTAHLNDTWVGGDQRFDATNNGVELPMTTSRFQTFTQAQYDAIYAELANGNVQVSNSMVIGDILANLSLVDVNER